jgi:hypothetical protein
VTRFTRGRQDRQLLNKRGVDGGPWARLGCPDAQLSPWRWSGLDCFEISVHQLDQMWVMAEMRRHVLQPAQAAHPCASHSEITQLNEVPSHGMRGTNFFSIYLILSAALGPRFYSASTRSRKIMFQGSTARPGRRIDNLTAICELTV